MPSRRPITDPMPRPAVPPTQRAWTRAAVVLAVLFGLFLMHGMAAAGGTGCHGVMPAGLTASAPGSEMSAPAMATTPASHLAASASASVHIGSGTSALAGDSCTPLRPDGLAGLSLVLVAFAFWGSWRRPGTVRRVAGPWRDWAHGPPRSGTDVLCAMSVCRT